jgi:hypothetical protein
MEIDKTNHLMLMKLVEISTHSVRKDCRTIDTGLKGLVKDKIVHKLTKRIKNSKEDKQEDEDKVLTKKIVIAKEIKDGFTRSLNRHRREEEIREIGRQNRKIAMSIVGAKSNINLNKLERDFEMH